MCFFFFKQKTAYEMRISDWSSDVCSSDLRKRSFAPLHFLDRFHGMSRGTFLVRSVHGGDITVVDAHSDRSFARHAHDTFGIGLITEGAQRSWSGRGAVEAACGQLITVNQRGRAPCRERVCQDV